MSDVRHRTVEFLTQERAALLSQVAEVDLLLELLDVPAPSSNGSMPRLRPHTPATQEETAEVHRRIIEILTTSPATARQVHKSFPAMPISTLRTYLRRLEQSGRLQSKFIPPPGMGRKPKEYSVVSVVEEKEHHLDEKTLIVED